MTLYNVLDAKGSLNSSDIKEICGYTKIQELFAKTRMLMRRCTDDFEFKGCVKEIRGDVFTSTFLLNYLMWRKSSGCSDQEG